MKFFHLADLHLGKKMNRLSMQKDQEHILREVLRMISEEKPDGLLLAGDIYDSSTPTEEAMGLLDRFLTEVSAMECKTFIISGNHDSNTLLSFGESFFALGGIYLSPQFDGNVKRVSLEDSYGEVCVYLLPYLNPAVVRRHFPGIPIASYTDAVRTVLESLQVDRGKRNVLLAHQFITGSERSESERVSVGGTDNVESSVFSDFDYVALGHIHKPQYVGKEGNGPVIRYSGSPLKYSFSEINSVKSVTVVELKEKGNLTVRLLPLKPMRDLAEIKGRFEEVTARSFYEGKDLQDKYLRVTITDEREVENLRDRLALVYPHLMTIDFDNGASLSGPQTLELEEIESLSPLELVGKFFSEQHEGRELSKEQRDYAGKLLESLALEGK